MQPDRFTKIMLVLIFLALLANLFRGMDIVSPSYAKRVWQGVYDKHTHNIVCNCSGEFLKKEYSRKLVTSPPLEQDGGGSVPEEESMEEGEEGY